MMNPNAVVVFLFSWVVLLVSCKSDPGTSQTVAAQEPVVQPPIPGWDVAFETHHFDIDTGAVFTSSGGSRVVIPPASLVDAAGNPVSGEVGLKFREFHSPVSIFRAGIPMHYDSAGRSGTLESAGMFELRVSQNGAELRLADGAQAQVRLVSGSADLDYNSYRLDETRGNWTYLDRRPAELNLSREVTAERVAELEKVTPRPFSGDHFVFDYMGLLETEMLRGGSSTSPEAALRQKARSYGLTYLSVPVWNRVSWYQRSYPANMFVWKWLGDRRPPDWIKPNTPGALEHLGGQTYRLRLFNVLGEEFWSAPVRPEMLLAHLYRYTPGQWRDEYAEIRRELAEERNRLQREARVFRTMELRQFGIYNYDRLMKEPEGIPLVADFDFGGIEMLEKPVIYYLPREVNTVIKFPPSEWQLFTLAPDPGARMFAILPDGKVGWFGPEQFAAIDREVLRKASERPPFTFSMEVRDARGLEAGLGGSYTAR